jgi:hypothetical protein
MNATAANKHDVMYIIVQSMLEAPRLKSIVIRVLENREQLSRSGPVMMLRWLVQTVLVSSSRMLGPIPLKSAPCSLLMQRHVFSNVTGFVLSPDPSSFARRGSSN